MPSDIDICSDLLQACLHTMGAGYYSEVYLQLLSRILFDIDPSELKRSHIPYSGNGDRCRRAESMLLRSTECGSAMCWLQAGAAFVHCTWGPVPELSRVAKGEKTPE